jgi:hypothetical protein
VDLATTGAVLDLPLSNVAEAEAEEDDEDEDEDAVSEFDEGTAVDNATDDRGLQLHVDRSGADQQEGEESATVLNGQKQTLSPHVHSAVAVVPRSPILSTSGKLDKKQVWSNVRFTGAVVLSAALLALVVWLVVRAS